MRKIFLFLEVDFIFGIVTQPAKGNLGV